MHRRNVTGANKVVFCSFHTLLNISFDKIWKCPTWTKTNCYLGVFERISRTPTLSTSALINRTQHKFQEQTISVIRVNNTQSDMINWKIKSILTGSVTQSFFPPCRNWPIKGPKFIWPVVNRVLPDICEQIWSLWDFWWWSFQGSEMWLCRARLGHGPISP